MHNCIAITAQVLAERASGGHHLVTRPPRTPRRQTATATKEATSLADEFRPDDEGRLGCRCQRVRVSDCDGREPELMRAR